MVRCRCSASSATFALNSAVNRLRVFMVDLPSRHRIDLSHLSQEPGPPLFDGIRIIDLRGYTRKARPATVLRDENVFDIKAGVSILIAYATGEKQEGAEAEVQYTDVWAEGAFTRQDKLELARAAAADPSSCTISRSRRS